MGRCVRGFSAVLLLICVFLAIQLSRLTTVTAVDTDAKSADRITRFLILGCDRSTHLTDSILLVSVNETTKQARILQIPRDTYAEYTAQDYKKLNGAMNVLGEHGVKQFLSEVMGVTIDYFVVLKLQMFDKLVDAIGGVDIEIPQDMEYSDPAQNLRIHLKAGKAHLDGAMAEQFVRYRSGYVNADLGRLDAQKLFLSAFAKQCKSLTLPQLLQVAMLALTGLQTDIDLHAAIRIVGVLKECDTDSIPMATLAGQAVKGTSGAWYYAVNREGGCRMINAYLMPEFPLDLTEFDPNGVFDRERNSDFHKIYQASESELPIA